MRARRRTLSTTLVIAIALLALVAAGCQPGNRNPRGSAVRPAEDEIATAFVGSLATETSASGQLIPQQDATLAMGTSGQVARVYVEAGDRVQQGDVLIQLKSDDLERALRSAEHDLAIQGANLAELAKAPSSEDLAAAQAAVSNAQAQLDDLLAGPGEEDLASARAAVSSARAQLEDLEAGPSASELAQAQTRLASAQAALQAARARNAALDDQLVVAQNDIDNAQLAKDRARDGYEQLVWNDWKAGVSWAPYSPVGRAVEKAAANYDAAVANYALTELQINDSAVRQAEHQVSQAQYALSALTDEKTVQIEAARAGLARAEASLAALLEEKTVQIASARAQLAQAEASLKTLLDGASEEQVAIAQAQVEQARISLEEARENLENATLTAPFDGLVTAVYLAEGEWPSGPAVELVNTDSLQVVLDVDEIDVGHIRIGQPARLALEPWPDRELQGTVAAISPKAKTSAGQIVNFEVHLDFDAEGLPVLTGMTANADLTTVEQESVLLVPNQAIIADRENGTYYVNQVDGDEVTKVEVTLGLRDTRYTEITSGLKEGDQVSTARVDNEALDFTQGPPPGARGFD
jgi:RND family efflux transporter MFP subunit